MVSSLFPHTYKKKRGASYRNSSRIQRPSHCPYNLNEQRKKAPRRYVYICLKSIYTPRQCIDTMRAINITPSYLPLQCSLAVLWEVAKFRNAKNKALINAFSYICLSPPCPPLLRLRREKRDKGTI